MFDNDILSETPKQLTSAQLKILGMQRELQNTTPFHLSKQQSISEIAPDTQRSHNGLNMRSSLENIYGLISASHGGMAAGETADHMMVRVPQHFGEEYTAGQSILQQSARSQYVNPNQLLTNMINPIMGNTTTEFYTEDGGLMGGTGRVATDMGLLHITDFEDHHANQSPFVIKSRGIDHIHHGGPHHQRDISNHSLLDHMIYKQQSQKIQLMRPSFVNNQKAGFRDDMSQHFETTMTQYMDDNDAEFSPNYGGLNLIVWGRNQSGQLGIEPQTNGVIKFPQLITNLMDRFFDRPFLSVKQIACGKAHTCLLLESGRGSNILCTMGSNKKGQLGIAKNIQFSNDPQIVGENLNESFVKLACSKNSTFAITESGALYSWGSNKDGILGLASTTDQYAPQRVSIESSIQSVSAGKNQVFVIVRQKSGMSPDDFESTLYSWGSNQYGQLGNGTYQSSSKPQEIQIKGGLGDESSDTLTVSVKEHQPIHVSCGDNFTIVQTHNGCLYSCGSNIQGQLGLGTGVTSSKVNKFTKLNHLFRDSDVEKLLSSDFTACLMKSGKLYLWGPTPVGQFNELRLFQDIYKASETSQQSQLNIKDISIGSNFGVIQDHQQQLIQLGSLFHENNKQQYDSQASGAQVINVAQHVQPFKGGPLSLDGFACGHDFVIAVPSQHQPDQLRRFIMQNANMRKQNQSRSIGATIGSATVRRDDPSAMYGQGKMFPMVSGRYAAMNPQQQSICSSLSPLRNSMMQCETASNVNRRNDFLNRSAIINGQGQSKQLQSLKILRESVTPVKEFAPPSSNLMTIEQTFQQNDAAYQTQQARNDELLPQHSSNYSTLQQEDQHKHHHTPTAYNTAHLLMQTPPPQQTKHNLPLQLTSSINSASQMMVPLSQRNGQEYHLDILIKEKQELQHSLNIEIQRRLLCEREYQAQANSFNEERTRLQKQLETMRIDLDKLKQEKRELTQDRDHKFEQLKSQESQLTTLKGDLDVLKAKFDSLEGENEVLRLQIASSSSQNEQSKRDFQLIEDLLQRKNKEIYELTVKLGCLKEENYQYKKEQDELKQEFETRINEVKGRAEADYKQLTDDYHTFQLQCKIDSDTVDSMRKQNEEQAATIKDQADKLRKLQAMNDKLRSASRLKRGSQFKLEQPSNTIVNEVPSSHYTSVGGGSTSNEVKKSQSQEHSFQSIASKRSKGAAVGQRAKVVRVEKENQNERKENEEGAAMATIVQSETIEKTPVTSKKPQHQQLVSHSSSNLFKKQQPVLHTTINPDQPLNTRANTNRDQGCLQVPVVRKKSAGLPSQVKTSVLSQVVGLNAGVLKTNNSRVNALNQQSSVTTSLQAKPLQAKEKTPTRVAMKAELQEQLQPTVRVKAAQSNMSKSPVVSSHQASHMNTKSPTISMKPSVKAKSTQPIHNLQPSASSSQHTFQLNPNDDSIFDPRVLQNATNEHSLNKKRSSQQSFTLIQRNPQQEVTLGGIQCDSSPDTPQIAPGVIVHQQEKPIAYVMRSLDSPTRIVKQSQMQPLSQSIKFEEGGMMIKQSQQQLLMKNSSVSSSSTNTNGQHTQIMNEMRNKLIDIQNNKQYIEQKIQEYEKKLQQLKGTSTSLVLSASHNGPIQHAYCDMPRQQHYPSQLHRSGSGLLHQLSTRSVLDKSSRLQQ